MTSFPVGSRELPSFDPGVGTLDALDVLQYWMNIQSIP